jgi:hypothetical protein
MWKSVGLLGLGTVYSDEGIVGWQGADEGWVKGERNEKIFYQAFEWQFWNDESVKLLRTGGEKERKGEVSLRMF